MVSFKDLVTNEIEPTLTSHGFVRVDVGENRLDYASKGLTIRFAYDLREASSNFFMWRTVPGSIMFGDDIIRDLYGSSRRIVGVSAEKFVKNVKGFLQNEGSALLSGDAEEMKRLEEYARKINLEYTTKYLGK